MIRLNSVRQGWFKPYSLLEHHLGTLFFKKGILSFWIEDWDDPSPTIYVVDDSYIYADPLKNRVIGELDLCADKVGSYIVWKVEAASLAKAYQGQGIFPTLYRVLAGYGYPIRMGTSISTGAVSMWEKLADAGAVLAYDDGRWYGVDGASVEEGNQETLVCFG